MTISQSEFQVLNNINLAGGLFTFFGSLTTITCYWTFHELQQKAFTLVLFLAVSDLGYGITGFFNSLEPKQCLTQAVITQFFSTSSIAWTTAIAYFLYRAVVLKDPRYAGAGTIPWGWYHLYCWGIPSLLTILPATTSSYGYSNGWCWFLNDSAGNAWKFVAFYIPLWFIILFLCIVYYLIHRQVRRDHEQQHVQIGRAATNQTEDGEVVTDPGTDPEISTSEETRRQERETERSRKKKCWID